MPAFPLGIGRGANANIVHRLRANSVPKFAFAPRMSWSARMNWKELKRVSTTQVITLLVNSSTDGDHVLTFSGGGLASPVELDPFEASTNTAAQIAAGLEALIQTARADVLATVVTGETVNSATITITAITKVPGVAPLSVTHTVPGGAASTLTYTYVATLDHTSTISDHRGAEKVSTLFPENVVRADCTVDVSEAFAGVTALTMIVGDANDDNGLVTSTTIKSEAVINTVAAAENTPRFESAFVPQFTITAASATPLSFDSLTAGEFEVEIAYTPAITF